MLRFIRDLIFPKAYDFSARDRSRRPADARREGADATPAGRPETAAAASTQG